MAACAFAAPSKQGADTIYVGAHIVTMDGSKPQAVAVRGDRIAATGSRREVMRLRTKDTRVVELGPHALLPGFIDAHSHVTGVARAMDAANLAPPPVGPARDMAGLLDALRAKAGATTGGDWVVGVGYDESLLAEQRHPTRADLDTVSTTRPILIVHVSGHLAALNSVALQRLGLTAQSPDPAGGKIRRWPGAQEPNGVLEEAAAQVAIMTALATQPDALARNLRKALDYYASMGITTVQDGAASMRDVSDMRRIAAAQPLPLDVVAYPFVPQLTPAQRDALAQESYVNGFRIGGGKIVLDGSIQGLTGYLRDPYVIRPEGADASYRGYPAMPQARFNELLTPLVRRHVPMLVHANGDAAIDMFLEGLSAALDGQNLPDHRTVIIHAQMMREDQIAKAKQLGAVASFFSAHPFFWGDWHRKILGDARAERISPIRSAIAQGVPFTIHTDAPVVPPDIMRLLWVTVNRETRSGHVLGPDQRATVMEALHAVTDRAAFQYFEEKDKGTITPGKRADLVILGADPLTTPVADLLTIPVIETVSRGKTVFRRDP